MLVSLLRPLRILNKFSQLRIPNLIHIAPPTRPSPTAALIPLIILRVSVQNLAPSTAFAAFSDAFQKFVEIQHPIPVLIK